MHHALALGVLGTIAGTAGALATWNAGPEYGPKWYPVALAVEALPCILAGGWLGSGRPGAPRASRALPAGAVS